MQDVQTKLENIFTTLSPVLQQAARYVVDNPDEIALNSMRAAAAKAEVHPNSMLRLARELGFQSYEDFRNRYRERLLSRASNWSDRAMSLRERSPQTGPERLLQEIVAQDQENLRATFDEHALVQLREAKRLIEEARNVYVLGVRSLYPAAFYFNYVCRMFMSRTILMSGVGGTFADELRSVDGNDALIAFSYRPYARDAVNAFEFARSREAKLIGITDSRLSPLAKRAHAAVIVSNATSSLLPTIVPCLTVAQALAALLISESGPEAMEELTRSERQLQSFNVYFDEGRDRKMR